MTMHMPTRMMISVTLLVSWLTLAQGFVVPSTHIGSSMHIRPAPQASKSSLSLVILSAKTTTSRLSKRRRRKQQSPSSDETKEPEEDVTSPEPVEPVAETTTVAGDNGVVDDDDDILAEDEEWEYYDLDDDDEDNEPENDGPVRGDQAISFAVTDVRALVGGRVPTPPAPAATSTPQQEAAAAPTTPSTPQSTTSSTLPRRVSSTTTTTGRDDSLERLLADAQQLQQLEKGNADDDNEDGFSIPSVIRSVISTIVTIDFFVVCGFLAWFLAGIFASSVLENDAIQIAFNGVFESLVQPALGILMLAALADAVSKQDDEQD